MKLIYLYHSGFALLGESYTLIFDYFEDSVSADKGIVHEQLLSREGRLYVFSSHAHADHFNRQILSWKALRPDIVYLLSTDIPLSARDKGKRKLSIHWRKETPIVTNTSPCGLSARRT